MAPPGTPPGTLTVDPSQPPSRIQVIGYDDESWEERSIRNPLEASEFLEKYRTTWVRVFGLGDAETLTALARLLGLHPLAMEDAINLQQRPKMDFFGDHLFMVFRAVSLETNSSRMDGHESADPIGRLASEQISLFLGGDSANENGKGFVISFEEGGCDHLGVILERIQSHRGRIRAQGADYLAYALLDCVIDNYYPPLEAYGERLEDLEEEALTQPTRHFVKKVHAIKRDLLNLRRAIWPSREMVNDLLRDPVPLISPDTRLYLKDCYDHIIQIIDLVETDRELGSDLMDVYLTSVSNRMNEIMKVLTLFTSIFMPMSFIAGIYGMNFDTSESPWNMPELLWRWGYPFSLGLMFSIAAGLLLYFWKRGWLASLDVAEDD